MTKAFFPRLATLLALSRSIWRIKENASRSWLDLECASRIAPCRICFQRSSRLLARSITSAEDRRGFSHFPSNVPSLPNSRERDSAVVISAFLPSRWVPYLKWEKAIMASVWITTDYNNGRAATATVTAAAGDKRMPGIFSPSSSSPSSFPSRVNRTRGAKS